MKSGIEIEIVRAVADAKETEPTELDCPLYEHIDFAAIRQLADRRDISWTLSFELPDHDVTVTSEGVVQVDGTPRRAWP